MVGSGEELSFSRVTSEPMEEDGSQGQEKADAFYLCAQLSFLMCCLLGSMQHCDPWNLVLGSDAKDMG